MSLDIIYADIYLADDNPLVYVASENLSPKEQDRLLWQEFQAGSEVAYAKIYENNARILYNYGLKLVNDKELIKDCVQDLFVEIWNTKHKLAPVKSIKSYLFKSIRRKIISEIVKKRKLSSVSTLSSFFNLGLSQSVEWNIIEKQRFDWQHQKLNQAMKSLTDRQREAVHLKYYVQLSYSEIAKVMSLSKKGAYKLMARSITVLRNHLSDKN
ncbi:sigma-70 family RNA polymerase sigma factor [Aurantibacter crassamenti]|uniref:RNA polymerase sigma factor n=1 Tax=Aurantibacter crassamenti TaxID=1837375 RepID=UPI00193A009F|nr:sigma-70 family RNA polymerase sigma factor [Aurantibacter crassamenti]MBM1105759.1 sigma-70 family RNA polymerase sigma factor [Aurantibacter crassamenti]